MTLLSFDVGIKHLAYCMMSLEESPKILQWNVLNLCEVAETPTVSCTAHLKNGKRCSKKAIFQKGNTSVCMTHAKASQQFLLPTKEHTASHFKKQSVSDLRTKVQQLLPNTTCPKKQDMVDALVAHYTAKSWVSIETQKATNASKVDLITIGRALHTQLSQLEHLDQVTHVIIENQISPIANRMKTLQGMIAQHFISLKVPHISFVSSGNKLKTFAEVSEGKTAYAKHKKDGVFYCTALLGKMEGPEWNAFFSEYAGKKDDLADSFLQALWYLKAHRLAIIPQI